MIQIIKDGKNPVRAFRFTCAECGCIYAATEDEGDLTSGVHGSLDKLKVICPMPFCYAENTSTNIINHE